MNVRLTAGRAVIKSPEATLGCFPPFPPYFASPPPIVTTAEHRVCTSEYFIFCRNGRLRHVGGIHCQWTAFGRWGCSVNARGASHCRNITSSARVPLSRLSIFMGTADTGIDYVRRYRPKSLGVKSRFDVEFEKNYVGDTLFLAKNCNKNDQHHRARCWNLERFVPQQTLPSPAHEIRAP